MTDEADERNRQRLEFLQADAAAMKEEIGRRSGLQERALALYLVVIAVGVLRFADGQDTSILVPAFWVASWLTLLFWRREALEIDRLGHLIRWRIARPVARILSRPGEPKLRKSDVIPSEPGTANRKFDSRTRPMHVTFIWAVYVLVPLALTLLSLRGYRFGIRPLMTWTVGQATALIVSVAASGHVSWMLTHSRRSKRRRRRA